MSANLDQLYKDVILDHNRYPRNTDPLQSPNVSAEGFNPVCGDKLKVELKVDANGTIQDVSCQSCGCSISVSSASIMSEEIQGRTVSEARQMVEEFRGMMAGQGAFKGTTGDLSAFEGVKKFPVRIKCALLSWATLAQGIDQYLGRTHSGIAKTE